MPDGKDPTRKRTGRHGGLTSWSGMDPDQRHARMEHVRASSPSQDAYWCKKLGFDADRLTPEQRNIIKTERKLYMAQLRTVSVRAIKRAKAERLRERAAKLDAEAETWPDEQADAGTGA